MTPPLAVIDRASWPDTPRWVLAHGLADDLGAWAAPLGDAVALGHDAAGLIMVCGEAAPAALAALAARHPTLAIIGAGDLAGTGRSTIEVGVATLSDLATVPAHDGAAPLPPDAPLDHLPPQLAAELARLRADRTIWAAWVDGLPVSFACATWRSPRWFDAMVDTAPEARQLGLATIVAAALIHDERAASRAPAWAAPVDAPATARLAAGLGLTRCDTLWLAPPMEPR